MRSLSLWFHVKVPHSSSNSSSKRHYYPCMTRTTMFNNRTLTLRIRTRIRIHANAKQKQKQIQMKLMYMCSLSNQLRASKHSFRTTAQ